MKKTRVLGNGEESSDMRRKMPVEISTLAGTPVSSVSGEFLEVSCQQQVLCIGIPFYNLSLQTPEALECLLQRGAVYPRQSFRDAETCIYSFQVRQLLCSWKLRMRITITACRGGPAAAPVDFLASYWPPASVAGLRGNAWFTSCPSSSCRASLIPKVRENRSQ